SDLKISSRTTTRSFLTSRAYWPHLPSLFYSSFFLEKKGPKIQASLKANAEAPEKCCAACTIFCALAILGDLVPIQTIYDCATSLPKAKNHSSASFFLSLVRLAAFRARWSAYFNSGRASKRNFGLKKISENLRYLRETKISSRTFIRSFQISNRIEPYYHRSLYSSFFLEKKGPKIQASLKANAKAPEKCCAACTIFCAGTI